MLVILLLAFAADPTAEKLAAILDSHESAIADSLKSVDREIASAQAEVGEVRAGVVRKGFTKVLPPTEKRQFAIYPSLEIKNQHVDKAIEKLAKLEGRKREIPNFKATLPSFNAIPKVGDVAGFRGVVNVFQVLGKDKMLLRLYYVESGGVKVVGNVAIPKPETKEYLMMMKGVDTAGIADGTGYEPKGLFEVIGTEMYETAIGGTSTVFVVAPFDMKRLEAVRKK